MNWQEESQPKASERFSLKNMGKQQWMVLILIGLLLAVIAMPVNKKNDSASVLSGEDKSTSTKENLIFSSSLVDVKNGRTGLVTQNFHIYRSLKLAIYQNYKNVFGIAAPSEAIYQPHFLVREGFALVKEKLVGNI